MFLYRFQKFMNLRRGNGDMLRWISKFHLSIQSIQESLERHLPSNHGADECRGPSIRSRTSSRGTGRPYQRRRDAQSQRKAQRSACTDDSDHSQPCTIPCLNLWNKYLKGTILLECAFPFLEEDALQRKGYFPTY